MQANVILFLFMATTIYKVLLAYQKGKVTCNIKKQGYSLNKSLYINAQPFVGLKSDYKVL